MRIHTVVINHPHKELPTVKPFADVQEAKKYFIRKVREHCYIRPEDEEEVLEQGHYTANGYNVSLTSSFVK
jgi:hypothetical protein